MGFKAANNLLNQQKANLPKKVKLRTNQARSINVISAIWIFIFLFVVHNQVQSGENREIFFFETVLTHILLKMVWLIVVFSSRLHHGVSGSIATSSGSV